MACVWDWDTTGGAVSATPVLASTALRAPPASAAGPASRVGLRAAWLRAAGAAAVGVASWRVAEVRARCFVLDAMELLSQQSPEGVSVRPLQPAVRSHRLPAQGAYEYAYIQGGQVRLLSVRVYDGVLAWVGAVLTRSNRRC